MSQPKHNQTPARCGSANQADLLDGCASRQGGQHFVGPRGGTTRGHRARASQT